MAKTLIEWCDYTFNHVRGCTMKAGRPGCAHCYAATLSKRNPKTLGVWGKHGHRAIASESYWREPVKWNKAAAMSRFYECPKCGYRGALDTICPTRDCLTFESEMSSARPRVFCASLADVFEGDEEMPAADVPAVRAAQRRLFRLIHETPNLDYLLLTKRPENFSDHLATAIGEASKGNAGNEHTSWLTGWRTPLYPAHIPHNVWFGFSAENQKALDESWEHAKKVPARIHFISAEPLLGPVDFARVIAEAKALDITLWVIIGGESGLGARPCNMEWIRAIVRQCQAAGVPCFVKQLGARPFVNPIRPGNHIRYSDKKGGDMAEWPEDLRVRQFP